GGTDLTYDTQGRVIRRQWSDGSFERLDFDDEHLVQRHTDASGRVTSIEWSPDRRQATITDSANQKTSLTFDKLGRVTRTTGPTGEHVDVAYDKRSRIVRLDSSVTGRTQFEYAAHGSTLAAIVEPDGRRTAFEFDSHRNLLRLSHEDESCGGPSL